MRTEKLFLHGLVTAECLQQVVGGPATIVSYFEDALTRWADKHDCFVLSKPVVMFSLPEVDSPWYHSEYVIVRVFARAVRVTTVKQLGAFTCWSELS